MGSWLHGELPGPRQTENERPSKKHDTEHGRRRRVPSGPCHLPGRAEEELAQTEPVLGTCGSIGIIQEATGKGTADRL